MEEPTKEELRSTNGHTAEDLALDRAETVCKFCGVSYLIFSEVKALEKKLKDANAKVLRLEKKIEKEKAEVKKAFTTFQVRSRLLCAIPACTRVRAPLLSMVTLTTRLPFVRFLCDCLCCEPPCKELHSRQTH